MGSNSFGTIFRITTWGESHGPVMGVVIDGCPAGLQLNEEEINRALARRAPGKSLYTSPRNEPDHAEILSGVFEGKTTGAPIAILIPNRDTDSTKYEPIQDLLRPGHANFTYLQKYGIFDYRGGGRSSGRETVCRLAAGVVANKLLHTKGIKIVAYIKQIGTIESAIDNHTVETLQKITHESPVYCPDPAASQSMAELLLKAKEEGDSWGAIVEFIADSVPTGLGDPIFEKLGAKLALGMMSLPATKGFEMGSGFASAFMQGSLHNDPFILSDTGVKTKTNHAGGTLGGISTGMRIVGRVAFKPPSSIMKGQQTVTLSGETTRFQLPEGSRHDPCVAIRAVPVVEAMCALVLADALLMDRSSQV